MILLEIFGQNEKVSLGIVIGAIVLVAVIFLLIIIKICKKPKEKNMEKIAPVQTPIKETVAEEINKPSEENSKANEEIVSPNVGTVAEEIVSPTMETVTSEEKEETIENLNIEKKNEFSIPIDDSWNEITEDKSPVEKSRRYSGKYLIFPEGEIYRYRLKASNGEPLIISEPYASLKACRQGIETLKRNSETSDIDIVCDKHGLYRFRLVTKQGRVLAQSANYKTEKRAESASESFKRFVLTDEISVDESKSSHFEAEIVNIEISTETTGKFEFSQDEDGFTYILKASNGRIICQSQSYKSMVSCKQALEKFRTQVYEGDFFIYKDKNGKFQFKLYNKQKRLVMAGEVYADKQRALSVIESIKRFAKYATLVE